MATTDSPSKIYFQIGSQRGKTRRVQSSVTRRPFASLSEASRTPPGAPAPAPPGGCPSSQRPSRRCPRCSGRPPRRTSTSPLSFVQNREASVPQSSSGPLGPHPAAVGPVSTGMPPPQPVPAVRAPASASAPGSCRPESPDSPVQAPQELPQLVPVPPFSRSSACNSTRIVISPSFARVRISSPPARFFPSGPVGPTTGNSRRHRSSSGGAILVGVVGWFLERRAAKSWRWASASTVRLMRTRGNETRRCVASASWLRPRRPPPRRETRHLGGS